MKNINENTKITLTLGQLKKLVQEANDDDTGLTFVDTGLTPIATASELADAFEPGSVFIWDNPGGECKYEFMGWDPNWNRGMFFKPLNQAAKDFSEEVGDEVDEKTGYYVFDHDGVTDGEFKVITKSGKVINYDPEAEWDEDDEDVEESKVNEAEENIVPVKFDKAGLMELGFRKMYLPDDLRWQSAAGIATGDAVVFCNQYINVCCGNDEGNRFVSVVLNNDVKGPEYQMINPTDENLIELFNSHEPVSILRDPTKFGAF